jgi:DNA-binding Xre family transcriptional regulator
VYRPPLLETDSAEMRAMKECIIAKNIDLDKYKDRFGANYPNDKRKLKDDSITLNMIERMCKNLDIKVDLVFTDSDDNVPNAMNKVIRANIIPGDGSCIISDVEEE